MNNKIQIIRGLSIITVVLGHNLILGDIGIIIRPFMNFPVAIFIFLSGYLTRVNIPDLKSFYKKRLTKILVPYVTWSIIYTVAFGRIMEFPVRFLTANTCDIYYYIFIYSIFVLITPLINKLAKSKYRWVGYLITPVSIIITRYLVFIFGITLPFGISSFFFTNWFIYYYLGILIGNKMLSVNINFTKSCIFHLISIVISMAEGFIWNYYGSYDLATTQIKLGSILTSVTFILITYNYFNSDIELFKNKPVKNTIIRYGDASFGIYLSHILVMCFLGYIPYYNDLFFLIKFVIVSVVSLACVIIGKKILGKKFSWMLGL